MIGNAVFKQNIGIPREIDPALFWENLFLSFDSEYVQQLISFWGPKAYSHYGTFTFIDDQCRANENAGFLSFRKTSYRTWIRSGTPRETCDLFRN